MKKVFTLQESWDSEKRGLVYPIERPKDHMSMPFYIEGSKNGELDEEYEMEIAFYRGNGKYETGTLPMRRVKKTKRTFEIHYKNIWTRLKATLAKEKYTGKLKGPKEPLWMLSFTKKEWSDNLEKLFEKHKIVLAGYQPERST